MSESEPEAKKNVRLKGLGKFILGLVMMGPLAPITSLVGGGGVALGGLSIAAGAITKGFSLLSKTQGTKDFWTRQSQKLRSFGAKAIVGGATCIYPPIIGIALISEGLYNGITNDDSYGVWPLMREAARVTSGGLPQWGDEPIKPIPPQEINQPQQQQPIQCPPVEKINTAQIAAANNYQEATEPYKEELKKPDVGKMEMLDCQPIANGNWKAVYIPSGYTKDTCPLEKQVVQTLNSQGQVIGVKVGAEVTCITPPVLTPDGNFNMHKYENGKTIDLKQSQQKAVSMQSNLGANQTKTSSHTPNARQEQRANTL
jgi:hypothetical protein